MEPPTTLTKSKRYVLASILLMQLICFSAIAQTDSSDMRQMVTIGYGKRPAKSAVISEYPNNCIFVYGDLSDTINISINDSIVFHEYVKTKKNSATKMLLGKVVKVDNAKFNLVKLQIQSTGEYVEFPIDPRYYVLDVYLRDRSNNLHSWIVDYSNAYPREF